jgi:hypothetical protein
MRALGAVHSATREAVRSSNHIGAEMRKFVIAAIVSSFCASAAVAQTPPAPAPPPASPPAASKPAPKAKASTQTHSPESIECSKQADAKGLHGKERVKFRANCKKKLMKEKT